MHLCRFAGFDFTFFKGLRVTFPLSMLFWGLLHVAVWSDDPEHGTWQLLSRDGTDAMALFIRE